MKRFVYQTRVDEPVDRVAGFYQQADAFRQLSPPGMGLQMHRNKGITEGSTVEFTMWLGPLPVRWTAIHSDVDWPSGFTDTQVKGPFSAWVHRHRLRPSGDSTTVIEDEVTAKFGSGVYAGMVSRLMWLGLPLLFAYRKWATRRQVRRMTGRAGRGQGADG